MEKFEILTPDNARDFLNLYLARENQVLISFIDEIERRGGPKKKELDFSRDSLHILWSWFKEKLAISKEVPPLEELPPWYSNEILHNPFYTDITQFILTKDSAHMVDGFIYYVSKTFFKNIDGLHWDVCSDPDVGLYLNKPCISGKISMCPLHNTLGLCLAVAYNPDKKDDFALTRMFDFYKICADYDIRREAHMQLIDQYGYPPKMEDFMRIEPSTDNSGCYHLYLAEHTEAYLGYFEFKSLKNGFRFIKSVDDLIEQNNQQFIVHSSLNQAKLTQILWKEFLLSAKDAKKEFK